VVVDRRENARAFEVDGRARRDSYLLMQAANAYRDAKDTRKTLECRALALDFDGRMLEAGNAYRDAGFIDDARRCLWRAGKGGWLRLLELVSDHPELLSDIELQWAKAICGRTDQQEAANVMKRFAERLENDADFAQAIYGDPIWREAIDALISPLFAPGAPTLPKLLAASLAGALGRIRTVGIEVPDRLVAETFFAAEQYASAIELWEKVGETRSSRMAEAKAKSLPYPANVEWLDKIGDYVRLVSEYNAGRQIALSVGQADAIVAALLKERRLDDALSVAVAAGGYEAVFKICLIAKREDELALAEQALQQGVALLVRAGRWERVNEFTTSSEFVPTPDWKDKVIRAWTRLHVDDLRVVIVKALARSEQFSKASKVQAQALSKFLRDYLRVKEGRWKDRITYIEAGAAYERAGRLIDMIQFYEAVLNERLGKEDELAIRRRWLVVKQRQLEYERGGGNVEKVHTIEREVQSAQQAWRIALSAGEPMYVELPQLTFGLRTERSIAVPPIAEAPAVTLSQVTQSHAGASSSSSEEASASMRVESVPNRQNVASKTEHTLQLGPLRVEIMRSTQRCLITDSQTMDSVNINWKLPKISGSVDVSSEDVVSWFIPAWNLRVHFPVSGNDLVILVLPVSGLEVRIASI
jgi:tetratricopeptide (TPR) repeat protein